MLRRLILRTFQSPGDIVMATGAVRDLHLAHPGQFETDVRTSADALWLHNPYITRLSEGQPGVEFLELHYPLIHESNQVPLHFIHGYPRYLEQQLGVRIPVTRFAGDVYLSADEKQAPPPGAELGIGEHFWIVMAGGKYDFTAKWWNPAAYQKVVDHFRGRIQFVQCGEQGHWHPPLDGVISLVGKTDTREFIRLMHFAAGVVCPVTFAMHLAAAVETRPGQPPHRPCVVIAGGREPTHWEAYPHHQYISLVGALPCCADGGCWKSRCQPVGDGDMKDSHDVCLQPVQIRPDLRIPQCMDLITPEQVIERIELYYRGGALSFNALAAPAPDTQRENPVVAREPPETSTPPPPTSLVTDTSPAVPVPPTPVPENRAAMNVLMSFRHGLGDAVQFTSVLRHLQKHRSNWNVDVAALVGKHSAFRGLCRNIYVLDREFPPCCEYQQRFNLDWQECHTAYADSPSTKAERCLREEFGMAPDPELCSYSIQIGADARKLARNYLETVCKRFPGPDGRYPVVLIHYEGNTSADFKNIPSPIISRLCDDIIEAGYVPVILDWDFRTALADGQRIFCPDQRAELWHGTGTGDAESLAALIECATLMIGVDSGPLHVAAATTTPTLGVWTRHHPIHYCSLAANVTHLVPRNHAELIRGDTATGLAYFDAHYEFQLYDDLEVGLRSAVRSRLTAPQSGLVLTRGYWIRSDMAEQDLVVVQDIAEEDSYRIPELPLPHPVVVDVGAHIGCFSRRLHEHHPRARIFAVECCPENIVALRQNVGEFATVVQAAVTYESDLALLNAVYPNCVSTGGSTLISRADLGKRVADQQCATEPGAQMPGEYWADFRPLRTVTLEDLMQEHGFASIDILKLDCEGSEFSILGKTPSLDRIGVIVGEYHGRQAFEQLVAARFPGWDLAILRDGELGTFRLTNPRLATLPGTTPPVVAPAAAPAPGAVTRPESAPPVAATVASDGPLVISQNGHATYQEILQLLRQAAAGRSRIVVEHAGDSAAMRQACDTFFSEHPEFRRSGGQAGTPLHFEK